MFIPCSVYNADTTIVRVCALQKELKGNNKRKVSPNVSLLLQQKGIRTDTYSLICNNCRLRFCSKQIATFNVDDIQGVTNERR